jgi:ribosome-associated heat shock protein Hsp15
MVNNAYAKPSREVQVGDIISVKKMPVTYSYKVVACGSTPFRAILISAAE